MQKLLPTVLAVLVLAVGTQAFAGEKSPQSAPAAATAAAATSKVDINRAGVDELLTIPGIGPRMAQAIVDLRTSKGGFTTLEDLLLVRGIKEKKLKAIAPYLALLNKPAAATAPVR